MRGDGVAGVVLEEAISEAVGVSSKRWALVLVAFVAGAVIALWVTSRGRGVAPSDPQSADASPSPHH